MAPFHTAAAPVPEDEVVTLVETSHYLNDGSIATAQPYYRFAALDDVIPFLALTKDIAETKNHSHKAMELRSHYDHLNGIKTFVISGRDIEMAAVLKWPAQGRLQLDAIIIREGAERTCLACGPEGASRDCVDQFLVCFRDAATALQADPNGLKSDAENALREQLHHAYHCLTLDRILSGFDKNPLRTGP